MTDNPVETHYTRTELGDEILAALRAAGKYPDHLTAGDGAARGARRLHRKRARARRRFRPRRAVAVSRLALWLPGQRCRLDRRICPYSRDADPVDQTGGKGRLSPGQRARAAV